MTTRQLARWGVGNEECLRARMTVSLALDGEAADPDVTSAALHLDRCDTCREFADRIRVITTRMRAIGGDLRDHIAIEYEGGRDHA
jgi:hypothetical protein